MERTERKAYAFHITDATGDTLVTWDPDITDEVGSRSLAPRDTARGQGMHAYFATEEGGTGRVLREFDQAEGRIVMTQQLQGG